MLLEKLELPTFYMVSSNPNTVCTFGTIGAARKKMNWI